LPIDTVLGVSQVMGGIRRSPDDRIREDELDIFRLVHLASPLLDHDAFVGIARVYSDALRRITDAESALWETHILGAFMRQGLEFKDAVHLANRFGAESTAIQERVLLATYRRQQERNWTDYTVEGIERVLEEMGLYDRPERPPAFAFLDLTGYTSLTEERGDEAGARTAAQLAKMVDDVAADSGGRAVKWLGDGVMVRFRDPGRAVVATLEMVERSPEVGLPAHAGIAAGPVVMQDGDYFGRTVNLAARIAGAARPGQTLVTAEVAELSASTGVEFTDVGKVNLKGFSGAVRVLAAERSHN
jgi:adenylate cyclase